MISIYYKMILVRSGYWDNNCCVCDISLWNKDSEYTEIDNMFICMKCWDKINKIMVKKRNDEIKQIIEDIKKQNEEHEKEHTEIQNKTNYRGY